MHTTTIPDYSEPLANASARLDAMSHALAVGNRPKAREIAKDLRARMDTVISWIDREDDAASAQPAPRWSFITAPEAGDCSDVGD